MTRSLDATSPASFAGVDLQSLTRERTVEMSRLLETTAHFACVQYGGSFLLVDRVPNPLTADIKLYVDGQLVDLWDLNPLLWDDAHWASVRSIPAGQARVIQPRLHVD